MLALNAANFAVPIGHPSKIPAPFSFNLLSISKGIPGFLLTIFCAV